MNTLRSTTLAFAVAVIAATCFAEAHPELAKEVKPPEGFTATVFATPQQANYPVFVAATPEGTLFVSSDGNASLGRDPDRGRVLRLRDTDGDGTADEVKTFIPGLDSPRGLLWVDDRLLVLHPPHVSSFRDGDGDGVAEERKTIVSNIAFELTKRPADHTSNGLALGVDGWVYAAIGDFGFMDAVGSDGRHLQLRGGGLVRFRPDGSGLEVFARGTRNNLEAAVGPLLDMIARDNTNDGGGWDVRLHSFTGLEDHGYPRRYRRFADEIVAPLADYGGGSGTGACWIDEPWMPAALNDAAFTCDWGRNTISRHPITTKGAGVAATQEPFIGLNRPTDLDVDAMGRIYASSWRRGSYTWSGPDVGFIARLTPTGVEAPPVPDVARLSAGKLVAILAGPSHRLRLAAQRSLVSRGLVAEAATDLETLATDSKARLASRVAAIFTLALGEGERAVPGLVSLCRDPAVAAWAVRALGDLAAAGIAVPADTVRAALASTDPRTRKEAVVAGVRSATADSAAAILPLTADADPLVAHTAIEGLVRLAATREADVIAACVARLDDSATPPALHRGAARVLGEIHTDAAADAVIERLAKAADAARRADLTWAAARLFMREAAWKEQSWGTIPDTSGPYYGPERWSASDRVQAALLAALKAAQAAELPALARTVALHRLPADAVNPVLNGREDAVQGIVAFLDVSGAAPADAQIAAIAAVATDPANDPPVRLAAIRVLARSQNPATLLPLCDALVAIEASGVSAADTAEARKIVRENRAAITDIAAVDAVAAKGPAHLAITDEMLLFVAGAGGARSAVRGGAASRLDTAWKASAERRLELAAASVRMKSKAMATSLVAAVDQTDDAMLRQAAEAAIKALGINAASVREVASDKGPKVGERKPDDVLTLVIQARGDKAIGMELFVTKKCVACHAPGVDSAGLGPSLANAASIYSRRELAQAVLQPNKTIAQGFATTSLLLDDGRPLLGFVTNEGADTVTLRDGQGTEHTVRKDTIEERTKLQTSIMPEGLVSDLSIGQFASLIDFIESIGK